MSRTGLDCISTILTCPPVPVCLSSLGTTFPAFHHSLKVFLGLVVVFRNNEIEEMNRDRGLVKITGQWRKWPLGEEE